MGPKALLPLWRKCMLGMFITHKNPPSSVGLLAYILFNWYLCLDMEQLCRIFYFQDFLLLTLCADIYLQATQFMCTPSLLYIIILVFKHIHTFKVHINQNLILNLFMVNIISLSFQFFRHWPCVLCFCSVMALWVLWHQISCGSCFFVDSWDLPLAVYLSRK
jgi:hypothetical protein